ncbi:Dual specificity protein phosphatase 10 [Haplosporangium sp. Z 27]|nr:Dual specificity protein phosphatase 10 [Haplosporangium sp. Z 27]
MGRPTSHSFSLQRPALSEEKKTRNSKRLSLLVPPSPGKLEALASIAAETPTAITPSFPPTPSFSSRRRFTSAPLYSSLSTIPSQSPTGTPTAEEPIVAAETSTRRISQFNLDNPLPTARTSANHNQPRQRPISAYFADFSVECGTASPYTVEPVCILPHLYLGAEHNAQDVNLLSRLGITSVLNVAIEIAKASKQQYQSESNNNNSLTSTGDDRIVKTMQGETIHYKNLSWSHHQGNLQSEFPGAFAFIEEAKNKGGKVLVHCQLGVSRSASLVIAYVMKSLQMNLTDAYDFVKSRSSVISPNMSLMYQLSEFGKSLNKPITTAASSASTISRNTNNSVWASSREDDEDDYPYPREMDTDNIESERTIVTSPSPVTVVNPSARTAAISKRSSLTLSPMEQPLARNPSTTTRPRSYYRSPPVPLGLMTDSTTEPPKTPMVDRFLFSGPPPTPMKDRFSFSDVSSTSTTDFMATRSRPRFPDGISLGLSNNESNESFELSAPVPPFVLSHKPSFSTSTTSVSSFATNSSVNSRPSSTSSASSASISICETHKVSSIPESADLPTSVVSARPQPVGAAATKIQTFAKAFTCRWSNGLHSCQQQPPQQPAIQANGIECLISSEADMDLDIENTNIDTVEKVGCSDPEFIFSPRPFSPSVLETKTFGEFYQALQME